MARPLYFDGSDLRTMSDSQLELLVYYTQIAYANQLNSNGDGYIYVGSSGTAIGSHKDTLSAVDENTQAAPSNDGVTQTYPAYPGVQVVDGTTYNYYQDRTYPSFPNATTLTSDGYLYLAGTDLRIVNTEQQIIAEVINQTLSAMKSNRVGTYQVATATPSVGGAGTWTDKGTWFIDKRYNDVGNTTYKLYLKRTLTVLPGTATYQQPVGLTAGYDIERKYVDNLNPLVANVLLPTLTRRLSTGTSLCYAVQSTEGSNSWGSATNTRYNQSTNTQHTTGTGLNEVYISRSTPNTSGTTTDVSIRYLNYLG